MAAFSAKAGGVTTFPDVTKWTVNPKAEVTAFGSSDGGGWKQRIAGTRDVTGTIEGKMPSTGVLPVKPGQSLSGLELILNGSVSWSGNAIVEDISFEVDVDNGAPVSYTVNFGGNGAWADFEEVV